MQMGRHLQLRYPSFIPFQFNVFLFLCAKSATDFIYKWFPSPTKKPQTRLCCTKQHRNAVICVSVQQFVVPDRRWTQLPPEHSQGRTNIHIVILIDGKPPKLSNCRKVFTALSETIQSLSIAALSISLIFSPAAWRAPSSHHVVVISAA